MRRVRYPVARVDDIVPNVAKTVLLGVGGECIIVFHKDRWHAMGSLCPHQNAPLDGAQAEGGCLTCKRHGYRFALKDGDCETVGGYGLPVYEVDIADGSVFVTVWEFD